MNKNLKRGITTVLTSVILISSVPSYGATTKFKDVPKDHWAYSYVDSMVNLGYLSGYNDGTFKPKNNLTFMEAMSTLSRLTNPTEAEKKAAKSEYKDFLVQLKVEQDWAQNALSLAIYKNIISKDELTIKNNKGLLNKNINKSEVAVYIAKAMGLEEVANSKLLIVLPYKDSAIIESEKQKYIDVLLNVNVLDPKGEGDGKFSPKTLLTRQVMATMLSKSYDYMKKNPTTIVPDTAKPVETEVINGSIKRITNDVGRYLTIQDRYGEESGYLLQNTLPITIDGKASTSFDLLVGQEVELTVQKGTFNLISIKSTSVEETFEGIVKSITSSTSKMNLEYLDGNKTLTKEFTIDKNAKVYLDDKQASLSDVKSGDTVTLKVKNNTILDISAKSKVQKIEGIIKEIIPIKDTKDVEYDIIIVDSKDVSHKFRINSKTYIYRNKKSVKATDLKLKDNAYIVAEYGIAQDIEASVVKKDIKGYIIGINTRFNQNTLVNVKNIDTNKEESYELTRDVNIKIDNKIASSLPNIPGYYVEMVLEGDEIKEVYAESRSMETSVAGKITDIDYKNRIIEIKIDNINYEGNDKDRYIVIYLSKDAAIGDKKFNKLNFDYLYKGDVITATGTYQGTNFVADTVQMR